MKKPIEKDIVVADQLIHYYHVSPSNEKKSSFVFLHGWGAHSSLWFSSTVNLAGEGYELYFIDLPGFGKSQMPNKPFLLQEYADIVTTCMSKLEIQQPILVGHSFGGKTAVRIASSGTTHLSGLILVDASGLPHASLVTQTKIKIASTVKPIMNLPFMQGIRTGLLRLSGSDDYVALPELRETFINIISEHIEFELPKIQNKTLILWGENDDNEYTPASDVEVFHRLIPQSEVHIIQNARHYSFLDGPTDFYDTVLQFAQSLNGKI